MCSYPCRIRVSSVANIRFVGSEWRDAGDRACRLADAVAASDDEFGMIAAFHEQGDEDLKFRGFLNADAV